LKENAELILPAIAGAITDELTRMPEAKWLVISRKPKGGDIHLEDRVKRMLPIELRSRVFFRTWGQHTATNAFSDCTHIMLVGGIYLEDHDYEAQCLAIGGYDAAQPILPEMKAAFAQGEKLHDILQAACRIGIRKGSTVQGDFHVYLIAAACHGLDKKLAEVFPQCRVVKWRPGTSLSGQQQRALVELVIAELPPGSSHTLSNTRIREHLDIHRNQLSKLRDHPAVIAELDAVGIEKDVQKKGCVGFRRKTIGPSERPRRLSRNIGRLDVTSATSLGALSPFCEPVPYAALSQFSTILVERWLGRWSGLFDDAFAGLHRGWSQPSKTAAYGLPDARDW
jgi:hypothetical protein